MNEISSLAISDNGFVFDPRTGHAYTVNATGLAVLRGLKTGQTAREISESLRLTYPHAASVEEDVAGFMRVLTELGLPTDSRGDLT